METEKQTVCQLVGFYNKPKYLNKIFDYQGIMFSDSKHSYKDFKCNICNSDVSERHLESHIKDCFYAYKIIQ
jgi:hypothetical protein